MNLKPDVLIVGAGVAGTCALKCQVMLYKIFDN